MSRVSLQILVTIGRPGEPQLATLLPCSKLEPRSLGNSLVAPLDGQWSPKFLGRPCDFTISAENILELRSERARWLNFVLQLDQTFFKVV